MSGLLEGISAFLGAAKQASPAVLFGIVVATGFVVFASEEVITSLGLALVRNEYRAYFGAAFLASVSLLAAQGAFGIGRFGLNQWRMRGIMKRRKKTLHSLTPDEKAYLAPFVLDDQNTQYWTLEDGVSAGLVAKDILYRPSVMGSGLTGFAHNIQPWAKEYLLEHPDLLEGANPEPEGPPKLW